MIRPCAKAKNGLARRPEGGYVVKASPDSEVIAINQMHETCMATPAISGGAVLSHAESSGLRGRINRGSR